VFVGVCNAAWVHCILFHPLRRWLESVVFVLDLVVRCTVHGCHG
jgi:hypothetical protein